MKKEIIIILSLVLLAGCESTIIDRENIDFTECDKTITYKGLIPDAGLYICNEDLCCSNKYNSCGTCYEKICYTNKTTTPEEGQTNLPPEEKHFCETIEKIREKVECCYNCYDLELEFFYSKNFEDRCYCKSNSTVINIY